MPWRHLLHEETDCKAPEWFETFESHGGVVLEILGFFYIFFGLSVLCEDYFIPSLEIICTRLHIPEHVAGATFMALDSSAPELFVNLAAACKPGNDLGVGAVLGSAFFNMLIVVGVSAWFVPRVLQLDWGPITRDIVSYFITVGVLLWVIRDAKVVWWEALILLGAYTAYLVVLYVHAKRFDGFDSHERDEFIGNQEQAVVSRFQRWAKNVSAVLSWPFSTLCRFTVPDCRKGHGWEDWYLVSFILCVGFMGAMSFGVLEMVQRVVCLLDLSNALLGLTIVSVGASSPDIMASVAAARRGLGDMAVSNALGSNIFNILCGLGIPWLLSTAVGVVVHITSKTGIFSATLLLLVFTLLYGLAFFLNGFVLDKAVGVLFFVMYCAFLALQVISYLNGSI